jgi:hypothetical protein
MPAKRWVLVRATHADALLGTGVVFRMLPWKGATDERCRGATSP